ncbi:MAG: hypothetical protein LBU89_14260 [Fibromonadaceae bacterium]|jgi:hypothetical protein|nr:hypothetical protein [Fibromonadaceae bacterium]
MNKNFSIQEHLSNAPGSYLSRLRTKFTKKSGLVQNSKILNELCNEILNEERRQKWMHKRNEWEIQALGLIYASGIRGLHFKELERSLDTDPKTLSAFLTEAVSEIFIWQAKCQGSYLYYGFSDFENYFLNTLIKNEENTDIAWISNEKKAELHLLFMMAKIQLGKMVLKKDNFFNHSAKKIIAEIFANNKNIDNSITDDEIRMQLSFLIFEKWISKDAETGALKLLSGTYDFLRNNGFRLFSEFLFWWERERFKSKGELQKLLKFFEKPINTLNAARLFWPRDTSSRLLKNKTYANWPQLPLPLRELWIFGILKMQMKKKHILTFSLSELGESVFFAKRPKENLSEPIIASSSNFEWFLSQSNGALKIFQMACLAQIKNEEDPLRFVFSKESFLNGLRSDLPKDYVQDFMLWNRAAPNVATALNEWLNIYNDSSIDSMHILRIRNVNKFTELSAYKPFLSCVEEVIPNWGFVIKEENEKKIKGILAQFSLEPHSSIPSLAKEEPLKKLAEIEIFALPYPIAESADSMFG